MNVTLSKFSYIFLLVLIATSIKGDSEKLNIFAGLDLEKTTWPPIETFQEIIIHIMQTVLIPIGYTYVQYPKEKSPREIWPMITWQEISSEYAGVFFRVQGGRAAAFGSVQEGSSPRLNFVKTHNVTTWTDGDISEGTLTLNEFGWSEAIYTGDHTLDFKTKHGLKFHLTQDESKPRNMAVRIWRRVQ